MFFLFSRHSLVFSASKQNPKKTIFNIYIYIYIFHGNQKEKQSINHGNIKSESRLNGQKGLSWKERMKETVWFCIHTMMRSKRTFRSTLMNWVSQALSSSLDSEDLESEEDVCSLQYWMTSESMWLVTLGNGIALLAQSSSIKLFIVCDSIATVSSTSKISPSELFSVTFFTEDIVNRFHTNTKRKERERERKREKDWRREKKREGSEVFISSIFVVFGSDSEKLFPISHRTRRKCLSRRQNSKEKQGNN